MYSVEHLPCPETEGGYLLSNIYIMIIHDTNTVKANWCNNSDLDNHNNAQSLMITTKITYNSYFFKNSLEVSRDTYPRGIDRLESRSLGGLRHRDPCAERLRLGCPTGGRRGARRCTWGCTRIQRKKSGKSPGEFEDGILYVSCRIWD